MRYLLAAAALLFLLSTEACAQLSFERPPINYSATPSSDNVAQLIEKLESGQAELPPDNSHGYLKPLLDYLEIPVSSQVLVFSKTSLQRHRITRTSPRAVYFNDEVYVGWVQQGDVLEISATDKNLGAVFYTLSQKQSGPHPEFIRHNDRCMICHASSHTLRVPGHMMRSISVERGGRPVFASRAYRTDHTSPFEERWGGWYVTGTHGSMRHMGNEYVATGSDRIDVDAGANITDLDGRFDTTPYLSPHSDIVALMLLGHQAAMHNEITRANHDARRIIHESTDLSDKQAEADQVAPVSRDLQPVADRLVECLLLSEEAALSDRVSGTSTFSRDFQTRGPFDSSGRSLRQLDLNRRLFRYPCSFLIYTEAFDALPDQLLEVVYEKLRAVLSGNDDSDAFAHLSSDDRAAITEILSQTKPELAKFWGRKPASLSKSALRQSTTPESN